MICVPGLSVDGELGWNFFSKEPDQCPYRGHKPLARGKNSLNRTVG